MKSKCTKCGISITLNKYELCRPCRTEKKKCSCGTEFDAEPGQKECPKCRKTKQHREYRRKQSPDIAGPSIMGD